ncbi:MAG: DUF5678 domain-containing protein [Blastocatellia bacterium]
MSVQILETIKQQIALLTDQEQTILADYLRGQSQQKAPRNGRSHEDQATAAEKRRRRAVWLKEHREEYAGQYVALDGDRLVGQGPTLPDAHEQARRRGVMNPFLVRVTSENEVLFGGW